MAQKITIECDTCKTPEEYTAEKSILILWTDKKLGIISHEVGTPEWQTALRQLVACYKSSLDDDQRNVRQN